MANYKVVDADRLDADMLSVADTIRTKGGTTDPLAWPDGYKSAVEAIQTGGGAADPVIQPLAITANGTYEAPDGVDGYSPVTVNVAGGAALPVTEKEVNFWDYDGTLLYSYTVEEAMALTELPPLPTQPGLICQEWNWTLDEIKEHGRAVEVGATYITDDGKTRIYITLSEGRTSPMLGCCPNGTVTVDWGDGTEPDVLTGTSTSTVKWTPNHEYAEPGDYLITLEVDGEVGLYGVRSSDQYSAILRYSSNTDKRNNHYQSRVKRIEIGNSVTFIAQSSFAMCTGLLFVTIPKTTVGHERELFMSCYNLLFATIPKGAGSIAGSAFSSCYSLKRVSLPKGAGSIAGSAFSSCYSLKRVSLPKGAGSIAGSAFSGCNCLQFIQIPDGVTNIESTAFGSCRSLSHVVFPSSVVSIGNYSFQNCLGVRYFDFTNHKAVPTLGGTAALSGISADCEIRVPAALYDEWIAATNWSTYASKIVGV